VGIKTIANVRPSAHAKAGNRDRNSVMIISRSPSARRNGCRCAIQSRKDSSPSLNATSSVLRTLAQLFMRLSAPNHSDGLVAATLARLGLRGKMADGHLVCTPAVPACDYWHAVWLVVRFAPSHRDVKDLLVERGLDVSYERVQPWVCAGPQSADQKAGSIVSMTKWLSVGQPASSETGTS
jgi:hypothetical protein